MGIIDFIFSEKPKVRCAKQTLLKDGIEYFYVKNKKSKSIKITVKGRFSVYISMPPHCSYTAAKDFVESNREWINKNLKKQSFGLIDENYQTRTGNFIVTPAPVSKPIIKKAGNFVQLIYPASADFYSKEIQSFARLALKKALYIEAKNYFPKRLAELAAKFGFKYNKLALKAHKTRWGSCSFRNNINLNINLAELSDEFIDYVLIHELCHTVEKNHGKAFYELMESCMPNAGSIRKELKKAKIIV